MGRLRGRVVLAGRAAAAAIAGGVAVLADGTRRGCSARAVVKRKQARTASEKRELASNSDGEAAGRRRWLLEVTHGRAKSN